MDHSAAIPVYIKGGFFTARDQPLAIFGPNVAGNYPSTSEFILALFDDRQKSVYPYLSDNVRQQTSTDYLVEPHNITPKNIVWQQTLDDNLSISAINVVHGPVPALAWRVDYKGCSASFSGDMNGSSGNLPILAKGTQLLIANNAIGPEANRVEKSLHMTANTIGEIAQKAKVKKLMLAHFMLRSVNKTDEALVDIRKHFSGEVDLVKELEFIELN